MSAAEKVHSKPSFFGYSVGSKTEIVTIPIEDIEGHPKTPAGVLSSKGLESNQATPEKLAQETAQPATGSVIYLNGSPEEAPVVFDGIQASAEAFGPLVEAGSNWGAGNRVLLSFAAAADSDSEEAAPGSREPAAPDGDEGIPISRAPPVEEGYRFGPAMAFGIGVALLIPVAYQAVPASILFYSAPIAFLGAAVILLPGWIARNTIRLAGGLWWSMAQIGAPWLSGTWVGRVAKKRWKLSALDVIGWSMALGIGSFALFAVALGGPGETEALISAALSGIAVASAWLLLKGMRGLGVFIARRLFSDVDSLKRRVASARGKARWYISGGSYALGWLIALTLPTLISPVGLIYLSLVGFAASAFIEMVKEGIRVSGWMFRWMLSRFSDNPRPLVWTSKLRARVYIAGFLLGMVLGSIPVLKRGPIVEQVFRFGREAAVVVQENPNLDAIMPKAGKKILSTLAESGEVREIGPDFSKAAIESLSQNPEGRKLLDDLRDSGGAVRLPLFFIADQTHSAAFEVPVVHGIFISPDYVKRKGWTIEEFLSDPAKQRELAKELDQLLFHELVHAKQSFRLHWVGPIPGFFPGQFDRFPHQVGSLLHLELEYEAHISDHLYLHEKLKADPTASGYDMHSYGVFLDDLDRFLGNIDSSVTYQEFENVESKFYKRYLDGIRERWPRLSVEGYLLLAERNRVQDPWRSSFYQGLAAKRATEHGIDIQEVRKELGL